MPNELDSFASELSGTADQLESEEFGKAPESPPAKAPAKKAPAKKPAAKKAKAQEESGPLDVDFTMDFDPFEEATSELTGEPPTKKAAAKKQTKKKEEPEQELGEGEYEGEFPDFSKFETYEDDGSDPEEEEEEPSGEEEAPPEEEEEPGDGEETSSTFDLQKTLKEIEGLKTGQLRKTYLESRARLRQAEIDRDDFKRKAEENERAAESVRQEYIDKISKPPEPSIEEYEPYQKIINRYQEWRQRAVRRIRDGAVRERLATEEGALRAEAARIQALSGREFDDAQAKFEAKIRDRYRDSADKVMDLAYEAAEFEIEAHDAREKFKQESEESAVDQARKRFDDGTKKVTENVMKAFSLSKEEIDRNPFSFNAYMTRLLNDEKNGGKALEYLKGDLEAIHRVIVGPVPPDLRQYTAQTDREEAKRLFSEEYQKAARQREEDLPMLAAMGLQAARYLPILIKKVNEQGQLLRKRGGVPAPTKSAKAEAKKKKNVDDVDTVRSELDSAIDRIG